MNLNINTPRWAVPILKKEHARYIGAFGGRGSGKSTFFAEWIVERCVMKRTDVVCVREVQKSLKQSVKKLIENKIQELGVGHMFEVQQAEIKCPHGGVIIFQGMQNHTADSIKSLEGFDIAWVEEAQSVSQFSLDLLRPTIRKPGSQLLFSWNPRYEDDPVETLLRGNNAPPDSIVVEVNYSDNPWFPDVLRDEMEYDLRRDPDKYQHIWKGQYVRNSETRVFKNWVIEDFDAPLDAIHRLGADWGFATDPTVCVRCHIIGRKLYIDHEAYQVGCEIVDTPSLFMSIPEAEKWPMVADSARPETVSHMRRNGFPKIQSAVKGAKSVEDGIEWLKSFDIVVHPRCKHVIDELTLYSFKTDQMTGKVLPVLADRDNHCIAEGELVTCERGLIPIEQVTISDKVLTRGGFQRVLFADVTDINRETLIVETTNGMVRCTPDHEIWTAKGFVRADALRHGDEVLTLEQSSQLTNTAAHATVRAHVVTVRDGGQCAKVYDLTVENYHEFFVNGVLVSNCIDAVRYALEGARRANVQQKPKARPVVTMMPMAR